MCTNESQVWIEFYGDFDSFNNIELVYKDDGEVIVVVSEIKNLVAHYTINDNIFCKKLVYFISFILKGRLET